LSQLYQTCFGWAFFKIGSCKLFAWVGFKPGSSWSLPLH
jgi:hypothetical protein